MGVKLYIGGHAKSAQGEEVNLAGYRMFSAAYRPPNVRFAEKPVAMVDSGAFSDVDKNKRLDFADALERQFRFERTASEMWQMDFQAEAFVSYDRLIDEKLIGGRKIKQRWNVREGELAVEESIMAAIYLAKNRKSIHPRKMVLSAQGVDAVQYQECAAEILKLNPDIFGFGGWCILGRQTSFLPEFWRTLDAVLPLIARVGVKRIHIFGVLWLEALGGLLYLADEFGITVSTDSTAPILACTYKNHKKSGARKPHWRENVGWWQESLQNLRLSKYYCAPAIERSLF